MRTGEEPEPLIVVRHVLAEEGDLLGRRRWRGLRRNDRKPNPDLRLGADSGQFRLEQLKQ